MLKTYDQKRDYLGLLQDEFRRLSVKYPPLYHERFVSPLNVSPKGWKLFRGSRPSSIEWEHWHGPLDGAWTGRFFGGRRGFDEFTQLCKLLSYWFPEIRKVVALTDWMEVLHQLAETFPSPLLRVTSRLWGWKPRKDVDAESVIEWFDRSVQESEFDSTTKLIYPKHPYQRTLKFNVFTSSVAAIQIIIEPRLVSANAEHADLPIVLASESSSADSCHVDPAFFQNAKGIDSTYSFKKIDDWWFLKYSEGKKVEDIAFADYKGFGHLHTLLMSPHKRISCFDLDPPEGKGKSITASTTSEDDYKQYFKGDSCYAPLKEGYSHEGKLGHKQLQELKEELKGLSMQINWCEAELKELSKKTDNTASTVGNQQEKAKLLEQVKTLRAMFHEKQAMLIKKHTLKGKGTAAEKAFNRVKKAIKECLDRIHEKKLYLLYHHLHNYVQREGWAYAYRPHVSISWDL